MTSIESQSVRHLQELDNLDIYSKLHCRWQEQLFQDRMRTVIDAGRYCFRNSTLLNSNIHSQPSDIRIIGEFFSSITPDPVVYPNYRNWNSPGGIVEHCELAGQIAYDLSTVLFESGYAVNPYDMQCAMMLHDLGRTVSHRFMETDVLSTILARQIGIDPNITELAHSGYLYWNKDEIDVNGLQVHILVSVISDLCAKRATNDNTRLRFSSELVTEVQRGKLKYLTPKDDGYTYYEKQLTNQLQTWTKNETKVILHVLSFFKNNNIDVDNLVQNVGNKILKLRQLQ